MRIKKAKAGKVKGRGVSASAGAATAEEAPVILDFVQNRIAAFNEKLGGGVGVRKDRHGYTLFREDYGEPVARLRPREDGQFAVLYWSVFSERWRTIGDFGDMILGLDDALQFISDDPMDCFWH
mgnify:CR=1 FL=1